MYVFSHYEPCIVPGHSRHPVNIYGINEGEREERKMDTWISVSIKNGDMLQKTRTYLNNTC